MDFFLTSFLSYPSGNIAVMITATEKGKFTYIVFDVSICSTVTGPSLGTRLPMRMAHQVFADSVDNL